MDLKEENGGAEDVPVIPEPQSPRQENLEAKGSLGDRTSSSSF